jgi:hypothetical protein
VNSLQDYAQYNSQYLAGKEVIDAALWDSLLYTSATTTQLTFFNGTRATIDISNMRAAGQLPSPESFLIRSIRVYFKNRPESTATAAAGSVQPDSLNDIFLLVSTGVLTLNIGQKDYGIYPLSLLGCGGGPSGYMSVNNVLIAGGACSYGQNGQPDNRSVFALAKPVLLKSQINFNCTVTWPAAVTLIRNVNIEVVLDGDLIRAIQ